MGGYVFPLPAALAVGLIGVGYAVLSLAALADGARRTGVWLAFAAVVFLGIAVGELSRGGWL